jgi:hypothetical protein
MTTDGTPALVALRDRREQVIQILSDSFANDLIDVDTFDVRIALAHEAKTVAKLDELVSDLAPIPVDAKRAALVPLTVDAGLDGARPAQRRLLAVFSSVERSGRWAVPKQLKTVSVFGNAELDFREAQFAPGTTEVEVRVVFGNLEIIVPPHLDVECEGNALFASFESHSGDAVPAPDRPRLRIRGTAVFGNVEITTRLPGESELDAYRRQRGRRHALPPAPRALPPREPPDEVM